MTEQTKAVEIIIDKEKCRFSMYDPLGCKKCMQLCPAVVFASLPSHKRDFSIPKEKRIDPTIWVLDTPWDDHCDGCGLCIKVCPTQAITIRFDGVPLQA